MAIDKIEGVAHDIVVLNISGVWYGIPYSQLVQIDCIQKHYGLTVTKLTLQDDDIAVNTCNPTADEVLANRVVLLRSRYRSLAPYVPVQDLKILINANPAEFTGVLASTLIP